MAIYTSYYRSPLSWIEIKASEKGVLAASFIHALPEENQSSQPNSITEACEAELGSYFQNKAHEFSVPLDMQGTDFQVRVWKELLRIPFGKTVSYMHIAKALGDPKTIRAVGTANGRNPIAIIVPCHRVIGTDGSLTGYAGGLDKKKWLLQHEGAWDASGSLFGD